MTFTLASRRGVRERPQVLARAHAARNALGDGTVVATMQCEGV